MRWIFSGGYWATINKVTNEDHIHKIWNYDQNHGPNQEVRVIYAYLKDALTSRDVQKKILGKEAPPRGGGFLAMEILHRYEIIGNKKGILDKVPFDEEYSNANGKYLEALDLLKKNYPEFSTYQINPIK